MQPWGWVEGGGERWRGLREGRDFKKMEVECQRVVASGWSDGVWSPPGSVGSGLETSGNSAHEEGWRGSSQGPRMLSPCVGPSSSPWNGEPGISEGVACGLSPVLHAGAALS